MTDEGLCASGKMGLCIKCPDCMSTTTEFKVGDRVRLMQNPDVTGEVYKTAGGHVYFKLDNSVNVYEEEDWEDAAWDLAEDDAWASAAERAELKGWAKGVSDMDKADEEVRVVNASTGGEKGQKLARFDLIPVGPLWQVAELYGQGATKYEDRNWEKGYDWSLSYAALMRHATLFWGGEDADPKDGNSHLASVVFHALALMDYAVSHPELDDRPKPKS